MAKEGRLKFNPRPGGVLNPEPSSPGWGWGVGVYIDRRIRTLGRWSEAILAGRGHGVCAMYMANFSPGWVLNLCAGKSLVTTNMITEFFHECAFDTNFYYMVDWFRVLWLVNFRSVSSRTDLDHLSKRQMMSSLSRNIKSTKPHIINILLASFARSVRQVMDARVFPSLFSWPGKKFGS